MSKLFKINLSNSISPHWLKEKSFHTSVLDGLTLKSGFKAEEVLATYSVDGESEKPLIIKKRDGNIEYLFDVKKTIEKLKTESYPGSQLAIPITARLPFDYNKFPMWFIGLMSKVMTSKINIESLPKFPSYPLDVSSDIFEHTLNSGSVYKWPNNKKYAVSFSHDVDTPWLFKNEYWFRSFKNAEEKNNVRSVWYVVPKDISSKIVKDGLKFLVKDDHEIGAHGYDHDPGLPNLSYDRMLLKLKKSHEILSEFKSDGIGYRAPWLTRNKNLYKVLSEAGYMYDSSLPTTNWERNNVLSNNGCCSVFPFYREGLPVVPVSLPLDGMYYAFGKSPEEFWEWMFVLTQNIKKIGGVAMVITHLQPHNSANEAMLKAYENFVRKISNDNEAWIALPQDIVKWHKNLNP